ncbi:MAG TPA: DMT family transporter, partial [Sphingomicrobium sp.]
MNDLSASFDSKQREAVMPAAVQAVPMIRIHMNRSDWATLFILAVTWGAAFMFIGVAVREVSPLTYVWLRVTIAAAAMWAWVAWRGERHGLPTSIWGAILFLALFNNVIPFILFGWGQTHIASGLASILNATTPIWGVIVAHVFTADEKISPRKLAGVGLGFGGVALMIGPSLFQTIGSDLLAQLACITAALCYAFAGVYARRFRRMGVSPIAVTTGQLTASAIVMLPLALIVDQPWTASLPSLQAIGAIVALGVVSSAFG